MHVRVLVLPDIYYNAAQNKHEYMGKSMIILVNMPASHIALIFA